MRKPRLEALDYIGFASSLIPLAFGIILSISGLTDFRLHCKPSEGGYFHCAVQRRFILGLYRDRFSADDIRRAAAESSEHNLYRRDTLSGIRTPMGKTTVHKLGLDGGEVFIPLEIIPSDAHSSFVIESLDTLNDEFDRKPATPFKSHIKLRSPFGWVGLGLLIFGLLLPVLILKRKRYD